MRPGRSGDSHVDQVADQRDHAARRDSLRRGGGRADPLRNGLLGRCLHSLLRLRHRLLDPMAQPWRVECGHDHRPGSGHSPRGALSVRRTTTGRLRATGDRSGSCRCMHGGGRHLRVRPHAGRTHHVARAPLSADSSPHLGGAPLRPWRYQCLDVADHRPGDLGNDARARSVPGPVAGGECAGPAVVRPGHGHSPDAAGCRHRRGTALEGSVARERQPHESCGGSGQPGHVGMGCARQPSVDERTRTVAVRPRTGCAPRPCGNIWTRAPGRPRRA